MDQQKSHRISTTRVVLTSFVIDISDVVLNLTVALISGSVVMYSQVLQGVADLATSGSLLIGVKRSKRGANREYQFGYGRELFFWALLSAVIMFFVTGGYAIYLGVERLLNPRELGNLPLALLTLGVGFVTNSYSSYLSYRHLMSRGKRKFWYRFLHSGMAETKTTLVSDITGTLASLLGIISLTYLSITGDLRLDGIGAIAVGVLTMIFALFIFKDTKDLLVGRAAPPATETQIREATLAVKGVKEVLDLKTMYIGSAKLLVNIEVHLDHNLHTPEIEKVMDAIRNMIHAKVPAVKHIEIELETPDS